MMQLDSSICYIEVYSLFDIIQNLIMCTCYEPLFEID